MSKYIYSDGTKVGLMTRYLSLQIPQHSLELLYILCHLLAANHYHTLRSLEMRVPTALTFLGSVALSSAQFA